MEIDGNSVERQSDMMRDYQMLIMDMEPRWPPLMYQEVAGGILQLDYGVATVLYATALGTYDGQAEHQHGGEIDTDGGLVELGADSALIYGLKENTIANSSSGQTQDTLTAQDIQSVPSAMGNAANGPQIPKGKDPIVFVPTHAMVAPRTLTGAMAGNLSPSDAQWAAAAIARPSL